MTTLSGEEPNNDVTQLPRVHLRLPQGPRSSLVQPVEATGGRW